MFKEFLQRFQNRKKEEVIPYAICLNCHSLLYKFQCGKDTVCPNCGCHYCEYYNVSTEKN